MVDDLDEDDAIAHDVEDEHALGGVQGHVAVFGAVGDFGRGTGAEALAEAVAAVAPAEQAKVPRLAGERVLARGFEQGGEFRGEIGMDLAEQRVIFVHARDGNRVAALGESLT
ncbi:hypothetical protein EDD29_7005 [Actinocorallia herbida]|uniref:Uncharacterized protein n=1 Tax=Actinocorallia herbida TaxID=58109 RepID=A0A3N1D756_9ACTN|nr:hypothetical protein [Actinocorallia herbida]ROO89316.1 hypothetical protein EDD29_7005 [Actinocorallia herbida]